jgi:hypothetical protein
VSVLLFGILFGIIYLQEADMSNKIAAVWARVSTELQQSLDSQASRAKSELEKRGYMVPPERILKVDWTSLDLFHCPEFQKLRRWIQKKEIAALGILDRDRLNAIGLQRLIFLSDCKENGVELVICQGPPILDEPEGQLVELALALGKERQVLRAQQGSRDALRERATVKGLPTTYQNPYGYYWDKTQFRLLADANWETRALIVNLFLKGQTLKGIVKELYRRGIPSPKGREWWPEPTISLILKDTVNHGEYRALRREAIEPQQRRSNTYGKSSSKHHSGIPLTNIVVEKPIITKEQYDWILGRLELNKLNAKRNSKRDYLLRSMIHYEGDNLRYYGVDIRHKSWAYKYIPRDRNTDNPRTYLPGRKLEAGVEAKVREILTSDDVLERELGWRKVIIDGSIAKLEEQLKRLDRKWNENANADSELVGLRIRGKVSDEPYERQQSLLLAERRWIIEARERIEKQLDKLRQNAVALVNLEGLRGQVEQKLASTEFADRRFVLEALGTKVIVTTEGKVEVELTIGGERSKSDEIALNLPQNACLRY